VVKKHKKIIDRLSAWDSDTSSWDAVDKSSPKSMFITKAMSLRYKNITKKDITKINKREGTMILVMFILLLDYWAWYSAVHSEEMFAGFNLVIYVPIAVLLSIFLLFIFIDYIQLTKELKVRRNLYILMPFFVAESAIIYALYTFYNY
jgi:hypothetical protein